ncbi:hypothetical protein FRC02_001036 [Tulasnella sp. 418]|nr:hypothetical protein FRC02_001036 [Tulasnella sp. 418]
MNGNRYHSNMRGYLVIAKKWDSDDYGCEAKGKFALQSSGDPKVPPSLMFQGTGKVHSIVGDFYLCRDKRIYYSDPDRLPEECLPKREVLMVRKRQVTLSGTLKCSHTFMLPSTRWILSD